MTTRRPGSCALALAAALLVVALAPLPVSAQEPYLIGPEDILNVQVWDNKELNETVFVRPDGKVSLPLAGEIQAAGKTVRALEDDLVAAYSKTVKVPSVTVIVRDIKSRPVFFIGGFGRTGPLPLNRDLTMLQGLSLQGGVLPTADAEKGFVLRGDKKIPIDFDALLKKSDLSHNLKLEPGDTVVVPVADTVLVQGEVKVPGTLKYTADLTLVRAVSLSGGVTPLAAPGRVDVLRSEGEKKVRIRVDLDKMLRSPEDNPDMRLKPDDIVLVPQRLF